MTTRSNNKKYNRRFVTLNQPLSLDIPLVVLVNGQSALLVRLLLGRFKILTEQLWLDNEVLERVLSNNPNHCHTEAQVKITISEYYTPSGRCIQALDYNTKKEMELLRSLSLEKISLKLEMVDLFMVVAGSVLM